MGRKSKKKSKKEQASSIALFYKVRHMRARVSSIPHESAIDQS